MPLQLEIVSPERRAFTDEVDMVIVPGIDGQLGILPHHTRLITALGTGELRIKKGGTEQSLAEIWSYVGVAGIYAACYAAFALADQEWGTGLGALEPAIAVEDAMPVEQSIEEVVIA